MRFSTFASAAALAPALASAAFHADLKNNLGTARVHNRCPYDVYVWSVKKDLGCDAGVMKTLKNGETYSEQYRDDHSDTGVSIKISKHKKCKGKDDSGKEIDITQLEYHINHANPDFLFNFLDVSFVDCTGGDCPGREALYLKSGNNGDERLATAGEDKAVCPIISCEGFEACGNPRASENLYDVYLNWDDRATKTCEPAADMDFYLCASSPEGPSQPEESTSSEETAEPTSSEEESAAPTSTTPDADQGGEINVAEAQITPSPVVPENHVPNIKTEVVFVTEYKYVNAKRHAHGHRHQHFRA